METEGFAIYDAMMQLKNEVCFFKLRITSNDYLVACLVDYY